MGQPFNGAPERHVPEEARVHVREVRRGVHAWTADASQRSGEGKGGPGGGKAGRSTEQTGRAETNVKCKRLLALFRQFQRWSTCSRLWSPLVFSM